MRSTLIRTGWRPGRRLIERVNCLCWPIAVRLICVMLPIAFALAWSNAWDNKQEHLLAVTGYVLEIGGAIWLAFELR